MRKFNASCRTSQCVCRGCQSSRSRFCRNIASAWQSHTTKSRYAPVWPLEPSRFPFFRTVPLSSGLNGKLAPGMRFPHPLGWTRNRPSFSRSVGRSSIPSSSVPSPYVRCLFGLRSTFGAADGGLLAIAEGFRDRTQGGRGGGAGGGGDVRVTGGWIAKMGDPAKTLDNAGLAFSRD